MRTTRRQELGWLLLALVAVWLAWAYPLLHDARHYFRGDTQNAYYGWFHHFGVALLHGHWPMLDAQTGSAGNPLAEGQMGLYSPLSAAIALGAAVAPLVVLYATLLKFFVAAIAVSGCFLLARSYGVRPALAAVAAVAVQLGGFTLSNDAPRWVDGQIVAALLPWAWWGTRRAMAGAHPAAALVACWLLVTTGYVYGTMYLILVLGGLLLETLMLRDWRSLRRLLLVALFSGLVTVTVYLPGILTSPVTWRNHWIIGGSGPLQLDPVDALLTPHPTAVPHAVAAHKHGSTWVHQVPFTYIAWFLPLVLWVDFSRLRRQWRSLLSLAAPFVLLIVWTMLPYNMGPIRFPGRVMSAATLATVLLVLVLVERAGLRRPNLLRLGLSVAWALAAAGVAALVFPPMAGLQAVSGAIVVVALLLAAWAIARERRLAVVMILASVGIMGFQTTVQASSVAEQRNAPLRLSEYPDLLAGSRGDVFVIGSRPRLLSRHPELAHSLVTGSLWDLTGKPVHNGYTTMGFRRYNHRFCIRYNGDACPDALPALFRVQHETGLRWVDLHAISTLVIAGRPRGPTSRQLLNDPPPGWHLARRVENVVTWVRDEPVPTAGGVVWTSPGSVVHQVAQSETSTSFKVDSVYGQHASVVLSRMAWPGYSVSGAEQESPLGGHLIRVRITPDDVGRTVVVTFRPPGWRLELAALGAALALGLGWSVVELLRRRSSL